MPDAETTLHYSDELELEFETSIRPMQGDSVLATAINTDFFSRVDSSNRVASIGRDPVRRMNAGRNRNVSWERLEDVEIPSKTWYKVVSHTSSPRNDSDPGMSDDDTTTPMQGEE